MAKSDVFFKAMQGEELRGLCVATGEGMSRAVVAEIEARGWTAHVITEFEFYLIMAEQKENGATIAATIGTEKKISNLEAMAVMRQYMM